MHRRCCPDPDVSTTDPHSCIIEAWLHNRIDGLEALTLAAASGTPAEQWWATYVFVTPRDPSAFVRLAAIA